MSEVSVSLLITIVSIIFTAGVTYGVMKSKSGSSQKKIEEILVDLKEILKELRLLTTELQVMKASNIRNESDIADHEKRIAILEQAVAKLQAIAE